MVKRNHRSIIPIGESQGLGASGGCVIKRENTLWQRSYKVKLFNELIVEGLVLV